MIFESSFFHSKREFSGSKNKKEEKTSEIGFFCNCTYIFNVSSESYQIEFFKLKFPVNTNKQVCLLHYCSAIQILRPNTNLYKSL